MRYDAGYRRLRAQREWIRTDQSGKERDKGIHDHATATAVTGTGVVDCDGGTTGISDILLNIYHKVTSAAIRVGILLVGTHLNKGVHRLTTANRPLAINNREWYSGYTPLTGFGYLLVDLLQALVGFQEAQCLSE